ncbi:MAG: hypothetical protein R2813_00630 [Flavobacteriales bacterium]
MLKLKIKPPTNLKTLLSVILAVLATIGYSQQSNDFVVLRNENKPETNDTVFGQVDLPSDGVFWSVKIITASGKKKFKTKEVLFLKAGNLFFASIPYGKSYAIVPRIVEGYIDLYFYYTGSDRLSFIPKMQKEFRLDEKTSFYAPLGISQAIWKATSSFYIHDPKTKDYLKVPKSDDKFVEEISHVFIQNEDIYQRIVNGEYRSEQVGRIVTLYNQSIKNE